MRRDGVDVLVIVRGYQSYKPREAETVSADRAILRTWAPSGMEACTQAISIRSDGGGERERRKKGRDEGGGE
jgi:hypothetical protein